MMKRFGTNTTLQKVEGLILNLAEIQKLFPPTYTKVTIYANTLLSILRDELIILVRRET